MIWNVIAWIVFGALIGWIASSMMRMSMEQNVTGNIIVGMIGAVIGGAVTQAMGSETGFNLLSVIIAIGTAMLLLALFRMFSNHGGRPVMHH